MKKNNGLTDEGIAGCWEAIRTYHHDTKLATRSRELLQAELTRLRRENEELRAKLLKLCTCVIDDQLNKKDKP